MLLWLGLFVASDAHAFLPTLDLGISFGIFGVHERVAPEIKRKIENVLPKIPPATPMLNDRYLDDYAQKNGYPFRKGVPQVGLIENFSALAGKDFRPELVNKEIVRLYENTAAFALSVEVNINEAFRGLLWPYEIYSQSRNQAAIPMETGRHPLEYRIDQMETPLKSVKGWYRFRADGGIALFGIYTVVSHEGRNYVLVRFPFPEGFLTVVLKPKNLPDGGFKLVTDDAGDSFPGHYFSQQALDGKILSTIRYGSLRQEFELKVDPAKANIHCLHSIFNFSLPIMNLDYWIAPRVRQAPPPPSEPLGPSTSGK